MSEVMETDAGQLKPGQPIRPELTEQQAIRLVETLYGVKVKTIKEQNGYDDRNFKIEVQPSWNNKYIKSLCPHGYMFKVLNSMDSQKKHVEAEHEIEHILTGIGINCPIPELNIEGKEYSLEKIYREKSEDKSNNNEDQSFGLHICRLMRFVPGILFHDVPYLPSLLFEVGQYTAKIREGLQEYDHPALHKNKTVWNLAFLSGVKDFLYVIEDEHRKTLVSNILEAFSKEVTPLFVHFKQGVIHGDLNDQNLLVSEKTKHSTMLPDEQSKHEVCGVLDFGDANYSYHVFELAIVIMYMSVDNHAMDPLLAGGHVLAGYCSKFPLNQFEFDALKVSVAGRYVQSLVLGQYTLSIDPGNDYVAITAKNGWSQLQRLWATPKEELYQKWREIMNSYGVEC